MTETISSNAPCIQGKTSETVLALEQTNFLTRSASLTSLSAVCLASLQASSASGSAVRTNDGFGPTQSEYFASYDRNLRCLKTRQQSLALSLDGPSEESSVDWPKAGMMCCGRSYRREPWVLDIAGSASGFLLPTPIARDWKDSPGMKRETDSRDRTDQLPRRIYALENSQARSGIINPALSLWLMGFPAGWLEIN